MNGWLYIHMQLNDYNLSQTAFYKHTNTCIVINLETYTCSSFRYMNSIYSDIKIGEFVPVCSTLLFHDVVLLNLP